jgi:putative peptidoglycan lipid II flippase
MSLTKSSFLFASGTLFSRITGMIRESVLLSFFGANWLLDAFLVAARIPGLFREMLAEGALSNAFTKVYSDLAERDKAQARELLIQAIFTTTLLAVVVSLLGWILAPFFVTVISLKVDSAEFSKNAVGLTRLMFPYLGLTMIMSITMGALHKHGKFFLSAISPVAFNIGQILGSIYLAKWFVESGPEWSERLADKSLIGLTVGLLIGAVAQLLIQLAGLRKVLKGDGREVSRIIGFSPALKKMFIIMMPATIAASTGPINVVIATNFATSVGEGAVSWLNAAFRIFQLPIGLFAVAIGVAVLPRLTKSIAKNQGVVDQTVSAELYKATELVVWCMGFCLAYLAGNSTFLVDVMYGYNKFLPSDTQNTAAALYAYSFGVIGYGLTKVVTSFYYAVEKTSYPMKVAIFSIVINIVGNSFFVHRWGHQGIAWTSSVTLTFNAAALLFGLKRFNVRFDIKELSKSLMLLVVAVAVAIFGQMLIHQALADALAGLSPKLVDIAMLLANGVLCVVVFSVVSFSRLKPWFGMMLKRRA